MKLAGGSFYLVSVTEEEMVKQWREAGVTEERIAAELARMELALWEEDE